MSELPPIIKKMVDNKAVIKAYSKGQITKEELNKRGIRLVNPLREIMMKESLSDNEWKFNSKCQF